MCVCGGGVGGRGGIEVEKANENPKGKKELMKLCL